MRTQIHDVGGPGRCLRGHPVPTGTVWPSPPTPGLASCTRSGERSRRIRVSIRSLRPMTWPISPDTHPSPKNDYRSHKARYVWYSGSNLSIYY